MTVLNESDMIKQLSDIILKAGANLFKATKYLYAMTAENYYRCDIKDFFKVILNNIFNADILKAFNITIDSEACGLLNTREYFELFPLVIYSFAVRLPALCQGNPGTTPLTQKQITAIYEAVLERGIAKSTHIPETFDDVLAAVRKGKEVSPYTAEWFRTYIYTTVPDLADITNRNLYFIGASDILFPLYYMCLENEFQACLQRLTDTDASAVAR
ncbi:hypothetical protein AAFA46_00220 [Oscillospiraceae bacterium WX1]